MDIIFFRFLTIHAFDGRTEIFFVARPPCPAFNAAW